MVNGTRRERERRMDRREVVRNLLADRAGLLLVTGLGSPTYDAHAAGDSPANFYLWGAMGGASLVALGLAQARPDATVLALTGDGEQLMGLGGLATIGVSRPRNLAVCVLDNGHFGETGMQRSHTSLGVDLAVIARGAGFVQAEEIWDMEGVERVSASLREQASGPRLFVLKVRSDTPPRSLPSRDGVYNKNRFRSHLGFSVG